jgi:hypothetical protein
MNFENDPIASEVDKIMIPLKKKAELTDGSQYNRVWEVVYKILKEKSPTPEQQKQKFEEILSPLIRYGYNTALSDIELFMVSIMEKHDIDTLTIIQNKIHEMMESKKIVDSEKLSIELQRGG